MVWKWADFQGKSLESIEDLQYEWANSKRRDFVMLKFSSDTGTCLTSWENKISNWDKIISLSIFKGGTQKSRPRDKTRDSLSDREWSERLKI